MTDFFLFFYKLTLINPISGINGLAALNHRVSIQLDMISIEICDRVIQRQPSLAEAWNNRGIPVIVEERRLPKAMLLNTITLKENRDDASSNCTSYV